MSGTDTSGNYGLDPSLWGGAGDGGAGAGGGTPDPLSGVGGGGSFDIMSLLKMLLQPPTGAFGPDAKFGQAGTAARQVSSLGDYPVGQVDVRTPMMQALEMASAPLLLKTLLNPSSIAQGFAGLGGQVPFPQQSGLSAHLFGPSTGQAQGPQGQPQGQPPVTGHPYTGPVVNQQQPAPQQGPNPGNAPPDPAAMGNIFGQPISQQQMAAGNNFDPAALLSQFGLQPNSLALAGIVPQSGLNLGALNTTINPQGYLAGQTIQGPQAGALNLFGPNGMNQQLGQGQQGASALQQLLGSLGINFLADGGPLDPFGLNIVGENGPEAIIGNQVQPLNAFANSPIQGDGTGSIERLLDQNPEQQAFDTAKGTIDTMNAGGNSGNAVMAALQPLFRQNLQFGLNALTNSVPSVQNSGAAIAGADLTSRALNDYNLLGAQAMQQGQQNSLSGLGILGQLAGQAGNGAFNRNLQAGQLSTQRDLGFGNLGLQAQQQQYNQAVNPTLQLLLAALGMATPTAFQTVVPGKK